MTQPIGTFLTGVICFGGEAVTCCGAECATHNCTRPCSRIVGHPSDDGWGCICDSCAQALIAARPSKFFQALDQADEAIEDRETITAAWQDALDCCEQLEQDVDELTVRLQDCTDKRDRLFAAAVGTYTCPCGALYEFTEDSTLEEYAALNRWLGHHHDEKHDWEDDVNELHTRIDELTADADDVAETLMDLRDLNMRLVNENAALRQERDTLRATLSGRTL